MTTKIYAGLAAILVLALSVCVFLYKQDTKHAAQYKEAIAQAQKFQDAFNAQAKIAQEKSVEADLLGVKAQTQLDAANKATATIVQLQNVVTTLKAQRKTPVTPIEKAQDDVANAQTDKIGTLEGAVASLQGEVTAKEGECSSYQNQIKSEEARAEELEKALRAAPKARPWTVGLISGKTDTGITQYGVYGSRSFGPLHLGVVAVPHFVGFEAGFSF